MLSRFARITAAVLSGVTASLLVTAATAQAAAQDKPVVVYAGPQEGVRTERISYRDLDLAVKSDQKSLHRRVGAAVRRVCTLDTSYKPAIDAQYFSCASDAWSQAHSQMDRAIDRAEQLALNGQSSIAAGAIAITVRAR